MPDPRSKVTLLILVLFTPTFSNDDQCKYLNQYFVCSAITVFAKITLSRSANTYSSRVGLYIEFFSLHCVCNIVINIVIPHTRDTIYQIGELKLFNNFHGYEIFLPLLKSLNAITLSVCYGGTKFIVQ